MKNIYVLLFKIRDNFACIWSGHLNLFAFKATDLKYRKISVLIKQHREKLDTSLFMNKHSTQMFYFVNDILR